MSTAATVLAPLLSVNEPESQVVDILVSAGQRISAGHLLCVLATTKANFDVEAETSGYIRRIFIAQGQNIVAGAPMFEISAEPGGVTEDTAPAASVSASGEPPKDIRITDKALKLARKLRIDFDSLPRDVLVTEAILRTLAPAAAATGAAPFRMPAATLASNQIVIYGAGGHAKTIIDLLRGTRQYEIVGLVADPVPLDTHVLGVPILGAGDALPALQEKGIHLIVNGVGAIERPRVRADIFERLAGQGYVFPAIFHRTAVVEPSAAIETGVQLFGMAFIGSAAKVGFGAIVNTGAIVSHDCVIGEYAHLTPGVILAGHVRVGAGALVGMGVTVHVNVTVGEWARIGNGARILDDVPPHTVVQAGTTWPLKASGGVR